MKSVVLSIALSLTLSLVATADDPPTAEAPSFTLPSIEEKYASEAAKADAVVAKAEAEAAKTKKFAAEARLKAYKDKLVEITKTGDFDKAQLVKAKITQLEAATEGDAPKKPVRKSELRIISAMYGVNQSWIDVTDKAEQLLSKKDVVVSDAVFGDPEPTYQPGNTLVIRYERKGTVKTTAIYSGRPFILP